MIGYSKDTWSPGSSSLCWTGLSAPQPTLPLSKCHHFSPVTETHRFNHLCWGPLEQAISFLGLFLWEVLWLCSKTKSAFVVHLLWAWSGSGETEAWPAFCLCCERWALLHGCRAPGRLSPQVQPPTSGLCLRYPLNLSSYPQAQILAQMPPPPSRRPAIPDCPPPNTR